MEKKNKEAPHQQIRTPQNVHHEKKNISKKDRSKDQPRISWTKQQEDLQSRGRIKTQHGTQTNSTSSSIK
jgi:hypothetical protein